MKDELGRMKNFNRETRENRESVYGLFFLVRAVRVVRGLGFSNGVSAIIHNNFNRETRENREQKGSVLCRFKAVQGRVQGEGFPSP
ncbi:MAG TPA: hypothetical protein PLB68_10195, partial [Candidatus Aminicenantes bacterium]|nr:hypothetical protein [Candidatus Aminicenantes bacterium]